MLTIHTLTLGAYQTNTYLICDETSTTCCIIDPGYHPQTILHKAEDLGLSVEAILLTHCHFDHVGGVKHIASETDCDVYLCAEDLAMPPMLTAGKPYYTKTYQEGTQLHLAGLDISVIQTPGHTPGSVCLMAEDCMFSGDTLFAGSCGRTDLPGGNWATILKSLRRLRDMEANFRIFPGHGESTTLAEEKQYNPYLR